MVKGIELTSRKEAEEIGKEVLKALEERGRVFSIRNSICEGEVIITVPGHLLTDRRKMGSKKSAWGLARNALRFMGIQ
jgi:hypothetical protein